MVCLVFFSKLSFGVIVLLEKMAFVTVFIHVPTSTKSETKWLKRLYFDKINSEIVSSIYFQYFINLLSPIIAIEI